MDTNVATLNIRHSIPGRLRVSLPQLRHNSVLAEAIAAQLLRQPGVLRTHSNLRCGSLPVCSTPEVDLGPVVEATLALLQQTPTQAKAGPRRNPLTLTAMRWKRLTAKGSDRRSNAPVEQSDTAACATCRVDEAAHGNTGSRLPSQRRAPWWIRIGGFLLLTGYLGYVLVREYLLKRPVAAGALSVTGVVALVAAIPLLRDAWRETVQEKRFTIHQFLAFSLMLAIGFGEALTAFEIMYVLNGGRLLEQWVAGRSRRAIRDMLALSVKDAWVLVDGVEVQVPVAELTRGAVVVIRTGEKVPVDGEILQGEAEFSEAAITGRAEPVYKTTGAKVYAGSLLEQGSVRVRADSVGDQTYLVKGGVYLEQLAQADIWCFDKTGTLTTEEPEVAEVIARNPRDMLYWAASAEQHNPHALAHAIVSHAASLNIEPRQHSSSEHILDHSVSAEVDGRRVLIGNRRLMDEHGIGVGRHKRAADDLHKTGLTVVYVAVNGKLLGLLGIRHRLRDGTRETLARLRADGVRRIVLISGDEQTVARGLADDLGLDACYAELLPEDKARVVAKLCAEREAEAASGAACGGGIVMIGDGVNDALALSDADIGIAMGGLIHIVHTLGILANSSRLLAHTPSPIQTDARA